MEISPPPGEITININSPQIEGDRSAPKSPIIHLNDIDGIEGAQTRATRPNPPPFIPDYDEESSDEYNDDFDHQQLMEGHHININNNNNNNSDNEDIDIISNYSFNESSSYRRRRRPSPPISPVKVKRFKKDKKHKDKKRKPKRRHKHHKYNKYLRNKKRSSQNDHYNNAHASKKRKKHHIPVVNLISDDESQSQTTISSISNKDNPIFISDDENDDDILIAPPPNNYIPPLEAKFNVCGMRIHLNDNNARRIQMNDGWNGLNLKTATIQGLKLLTNVNLPRKEGKALIDKIRHGFAHLIGESLSYSDRLTAMVIGLIEIMDLHQHNDAWFDSTRKPQVLVVAPRRHMALQARQMFMHISQFYQMNASCLIGGISTRQCLNRLSGGVQIITGTPGKLMDMILRGHINADYLSNLICVALDGAEELNSSISMCKQMDVIKSAMPKREIRVLSLHNIVLPHTKQTAEREIRNMDENINCMREERARIDYLQDKPCIFKMIQNMVHIEKSCGFDAIKRKTIYNIVRKYGESFGNIVVFVNSKESLRRNFEQFVEMDFGKAMFCIDGLCKNDERNYIIRTWKEGGGILFSTDLMNLGLSLDIGMIINFNVPDFSALNCYINRCGISTCKKALIFTLVANKKDEENMDRIRGYLKINTKHANYIV